MISDLLVRWVAETGEGSIRDLRARAAWASRTCDRPVRPTETGRWVRDLASMGHLEADWSADRWSACPLVLTRLPGPDGYALFAGPRTAAQDRKIGYGDFAVQRVAQPSGDESCLDRPTVVLVQCDDGGDLPDAARSVGAEWVPCSAVSLAERLPKLGLGGPAAPPASDDPLERYDTGTLSWVPVRPADGLTDGAYRVKRTGRKAHLYLEAGAWKHCDLSAAVHVALAREARSSIRWRPDSPAAARSSGTFFSDWGAPLHPLHQRALVLCTGFVPRFSPGARTGTYPNVPRAVADAVAAAVGQHLDSA